MPKTKSMRGDRVVRGGPLAQDILKEGEVKVSGRKKTRKRKEGDDQYVESDLTKKILTEARKQQLELEEEHGISEPKATPSRNHGKGKKSLVSLKDDEDDSAEVEISKSEDRAAAAEGMVGQVKVHPDEERAFEMFMSKKGHRTLADIIQSKLTEKRTEIESVMSDVQGGRVQDLKPEVVKCFTKVGEVLEVYRRGKLPIIFKTLPMYQQWEECLYVTRPDKWTSASMYAATRIFSSNLCSSSAQRFYTMFLLPRIRDEIAEYKRLNFHIMQALKKSLFKTRAFFKGIVLPLMDSEDCTLREALIICSVIREHHIPMHFAGAAILCICDRKYTGATSIFLRTLLDKKYSLPYSAVDGVCNHFLKFQDDDRRMHVLWHQALLTFAQRYKTDLYEGQKKELFGLMRKHFHPEISPEIRRELESQKSTRE